MAKNPVTGIVEKENSCVDSEKSKEYVEISYGHRRLQMKTENKKIVSGIGWAYAERLSAQIVTFVVSVVLARLIAPDAFGMIAIVMTFINICDALTIGGFGNALVQKKDADNRDFNTICWVSIGVAVFLYVILFVFSGAIERFYDMDGLGIVIKVMGIRVIVSAFNSVQQAFVQRKMKFKKFFYATLGGTLASAGVGIGMAVSGFGIWALVGQYMTNSIINTLTLFFIVEWKPAFEFSLKSLKELWGFGLKMLLSTMTYTAKDSIRSLIIGKKYSSSDLAYYNQGQKYPSLLMSDFVDSIGKVLFPFLSEKQGNKNEMKTYMRKSIRASAFILCPVLLGLIAVADTFVVAILSNKWVGCVIYLRILSLVYLTRPLSTVFQKSLLAIGNTSVNLAHELITSVLTILMMLVCVFCIDSIPLIAWSYVIITVVGTSFFAFFTKKNFQYGYLEMLRDYLPALLVSCLMACAVFAVGQIPMNIYLKLIVQVIAGIGVYFVVTFLLKFEAMQMVMQIIRRKR